MTIDKTTETATPIIIIFFVLEFKFFAVSFIFVSIEITRSFKIYPSLSL